MGAIEYRNFNRALLAALTGVLGILFVAAMSPARIKCMWHSQYGVECPTCHLTRALERLVVGDLRGSVKEHVGAVVLVGFLFIQVGLRVFVEHRCVTGFRTDLSITGGMLVVVWWSLNGTH